MFTVDLGFSSAKWIYSKKKGRIKSVFRETHRDDGYLLGGTRYVLGEKALLQTGSYYLRTIEELVDYYPLFVAYSAEKAGIRGSDVLVTGLPFDFWQCETEKRKKGDGNVISSMEERLRRIEINGHVLQFDKVLVLPQGLGCIRAFLSGRREARGNVLGIDIGFNTVIYALYSIDEKELLYGKTLYKKGVHDMADNTLRIPIERHCPGKSFTPAEINHVMETGRIQIGFDQVDVTPEIIDAASGYTTRLLGTIVGDLKESAGVVTFDNVVFAGGGARLLGKAAVKASKVSVHILDEPEFANAEGFVIVAGEMAARDEEAKPASGENCQAREKS